MVIFCPNFSLIFFSSSVALVLRIPYSVLYGGHCYAKVNCVLCAPCNNSLILNVNKKGSTKKMKREPNSMSRMQNECLDVKRREHSASTNIVSAL